MENKGLKIYRSLPPADISSHSDCVQNPPMLCCSSPSGRRFSPHGTWSSALLRSQRSPLPPQWPLNITFEQVFWHLWAKTSWIIIQTSTGHSKSSSVQRSDVPVHQWPLIMTMRCIKVVFAVYIISYSDHYTLSVHPYIFFHLFGVGDTLSV